MAYKTVRYKLLTYTLRLCLVTPALCLFFLIPALNAGTATGSRSAQVEVIRLDGGDWGYPTPYAHYPRGPGGFKMCLIFDSLLERGDQGIIPWLATSWQVEDQGKAYIFTLRQGVKWHDGNPMTPEDVAFSLDYATRFPMTWSYVFDRIDQVEILEDDRIKVTLKTPTASMLYSLGTSRIIPKHIWEKVDNPKTFTKPEAVTGTGPYRLTGYSREHGTYRFEAFKDFWGPAVRVKRLEFIPVSEPILAYQKHEIDLIRVSPDLLPRFQNNPEHKILKSPGFWGYRLLFNRNLSGPDRMIQVRQAFAYAIDLNELVAKVARGAALPGRAGILPPDHVMAAQKVRFYDFNPEKAGRLLDQAGFTLTRGSVRTGPEGKPLVFDLLCAGGEVRMAEILKQRLAAVGVDIRIKSCNGKTRDSQVRNQNYDLAIIGHGGWGRDPDYLIAHCTGDIKKSSSPSAFGGSGLASPALAQLLKAQRAQTDPEKRRELVVKIQHMAAEEVPEIPLFYTTGYSVFRPAKYDGWMFMFDHHSLVHGKLSYLNWKAWH
jgi:peptide/nickel transport system substrate-binding protein